jgi:kumamolisin
MSCAREACVFLRNSDLKNNGGTHCCNACKRGEGHGSACQKKSLPSDILFKPKSSLHVALDTNAEILPRASGRRWFYPNELATIYNFPAVPQTPPTKVIGVISFGGGVNGTIDSYGKLTNSDIQTYWINRGIAPISQPQVIVVFLNGATNDTSDTLSTSENTLDIETIGACYPSQNLTIILYITTNAISSFAGVITAASSPTTVNGRSYGTPNVISISWGAPEIYFSSAELNLINSAMAAASAKGINICVATGDNGSNDGVGGSGSYVDFPSSSPYSTAVGGTKLVCTDNTYTGATVETAWTSGGGAISSFFPKPSYQSAIVRSGRSVPDIASDADPSTGVLYYIAGQNYIFGGTSVAAPTVAAFLAAAGISTFVNPLLYNAPSNCFHDIQAGSNGNFTSTGGYDNCTGLGSINGANLLLAFNPVKVTNISFIFSTFSLNINQTVTPTPIITPSNAANKLVSWSTNNSNIATVSNAGLITAKNLGNATITCSSTDGSNKSATVTVRVIPIMVSSISITGASTVKIGAKIQLSANVLPTNAANKQVQWNSLNNNVSVSSTGLVSGLRVGYATIRCTSMDGSNTIASFYITVASNSSMVSSRLFNQAV